MRIALLNKIHACKFLSTYQWLCDQCSCIVCFSDFRYPIFISMYRDFLITSTSVSDNYFHKPAQQSNN